jgi:hypothetical protein
LSALAAGVSRLARQASPASRACSESLHSEGHNPGLNPAEGLTRGSNHMSSEKNASGEIMQSSTASCTGPLSGSSEAASQPSVICKSRGYIGAMNRKFVGDII